MPKNRIPIPRIGERFERFTVVDNTKRKHNQYACLCRCDCGNYRVITNSELYEHRYKSCGCGKRSINGKSHTRLYGIYRHMKERCYNPSCDAYEKYGARGIDICPEWLTDFLSFYDWALESGYQDDLTIDRIDNNKGYSPENCRWATAETQQNNTRWNHNITFNGKTQSLSKWSKELGVPITTLYGRLSKGWSIEDSFSKEPYKPFDHVKAEKGRKVS